MTDDNNLTTDNTDDVPYLVECDANTREPAQTINVGTESTLGPDFIGQESVTVRGHKADRPGVRSRLPESDSDDPRISRMDTGESLPVLLSSDMQTSVTEGVNGTYTKIIEGECVRCGYDRLVVSTTTLPHRVKTTCNACEVVQDVHTDSGYRMPQTDGERTREERNLGPQIGSLLSRDVIDLEPDTGIGEYISLVGNRSHQRLRKDDVADLFVMLVRNKDISITDLLESEFDAIDRAVVLMILAREFDVEINNTTSDEDTDE